MRNRNPASAEVEQVIRASEILAVARALHAGDRLRVGQSIDYFIEPEACGLKAKSTRSGKPYRVPVEQWHLDEAGRILEQWKGDSTKKDLLQRA